MGCEKRRTGRGQGISGDGGEVAGTAQEDSSRQT